MKALFSVTMLVAGLLTLSPADLLADELVGVIKTASETVVMRDGETMTAMAGMEVKRGDILKTGANGAAGLIFSDDTVISMGARTELAVEAYLFEPAEGKLSCILEILKGTISYLSGQIAKLAPESVELLTPAATIGVRGTHVLIKVD